MTTTLPTDAAADPAPATPAPAPAPGAEDLGCPDVSATEPLDFLFDGPPRDYLYVLERLVLTTGAIQNWETWSAYYRSAALSRGWKRIFLSTEITGDPRLFIQLWRVPSRFSIDVELAAMRGEANYQRALTGVTRFEHEVLAPMPYDVGPTADAGEAAEVPTPHRASAKVLLLDRISVKKGSMARFACLKAKYFIPRVTTEHGWRLVAAGSALTGPAATVIQCWELPGSNTLLSTMRGMSQDGVYRKYLGPCVEAEQQDLYEQLT